MSKIRILGKVASDVVTGTLPDSNLFTSYWVSVAPTSNNGNTSYFAVMAIGKQAEIQVTKDSIVEVDGEFEVKQFQLNASSAPKDAIVVQPQQTLVFKSHSMQYAKAYNILGNYTKQAAKVYTPQNGKNTVYTQTLAVNKYQKGNPITFYIDIKLFGNRGDALFNNKLLSKEAVTSVLVDGNVLASYVSKDDTNNPGQKIQFFNYSINVNDFQIANRVKNGQQHRQSNNYNNAQGNSQGSHEANQTNYGSSYNQQQHASGYPEGQEPF